MPEQIPVQEPMSEREAVIYVPGLFAGEGDQSADRVGQRIAAAFDAQAKTRILTYSSTPAFTFPFPSSDAKVEVVTVTELDPRSNRSTPLVDVYALDYARSFRETAEKRPPIVQAFLVAFLVFTNVLRVARSLFLPAQSLGRRLQALWAVALVFLLVAYLIVLGYAAVDAARTFYRGQVPEAQQPAQQTAAAATTQKPKTAKPAAPQKRRTIDLQALIVLLTALGFFTRASLKEIISRAGVQASGALGYLAFGMKAGEMHGALDYLVEHVHQEGREHNTHYKRVHLIAYSFGSVISLNSLFPRGGETPPQSVDKIDGLVTIGCPFDFIRSYWPDYFLNRGHLEATPSRWLNVYRRDDILASNFNDGDDRPRGVGIKGADERMPQNLLFGPDDPVGAGALVLAGFRAHGDYWSKETTIDRNAFNPVVAFLFPDQLAPKDAAAPQQIAN